MTEETMTFIDAQTRQRSTKWEDNDIRKNVQMKKRGMKSRGTTTTVTYEAIHANVLSAIRSPWFTKKQLLAISMVLFGAVAPFVTMAMMTAYWPQFSTHGDRFIAFYYAFSRKVVSCDTEYTGVPTSRTVGALESFFLLDYTFGQFPFSQAKVIDLAWDTIVGRGVQLSAWWIGYVVFSDALLRLIERHPASFETFSHIALDGASLASLWTLLKNLFRTRSRRTWILFFYMFLSISYILSIPALLAAMTGYDVTLSAWVDIDKDQIIPSSSFKPMYAVLNAGNTTFGNGTCSASEQIEAYRKKSAVRASSCDCLMPNGTVVPYTTWEYLWSDAVSAGNTTNGLQDCIYNFPNNTKTYQSSGETLSCNNTLYISILGNEYDGLHIHSTYTFCWNDKPYSLLDLQEISRCLPDANPTYSWGFSTTILGVFIIIHFVWAVSMYAIWQDAQFNSAIVKNGYKMTKLRAIFALAEAARRKTGLGKELVHEETKSLEKELHGNRRKKRIGAEVDFEIFREVGYKLGKTSTNG